jgi:hypothetical protein
MRLPRELRCPNVGHPDLDRPQPLLAQTSPMLADTCA